ncbi:MAG TPA: hypothetical protein VIX42_12200, partial [Edaphobacter sp.]
MGCFGAGVWRGGFCSALAVGAAVVGMMTLQGRPSGAKAEGDDPDRRCAGCHAAIYAKWEKTTMARGSGWATDGLIRGSFLHERSGVNYRVDSKDGEAWLRYERIGLRPEGTLRGEERLVYYIGSGRQGRTYLFKR